MPGIPVVPPITLGAAAAVDLARSSPAQARGGTSRSPWTQAVVEPVALVVLVAASLFLPGPSWLVLGVLAPGVLLWSAADAVRAVDRGEPRRRVSARRRRGSTAAVMVCGLTLLEAARPLFAGLHPYLLGVDGLGWAPGAPHLGAMLSGNPVALIAGLGLVGGRLLVRVDRLLGVGLQLLTGFDRPEAPQRAVGPVALATLVAGLAVYAPAALKVLDIMVVEGSLAQHGSTVVLLLAGAVAGLVVALSVSTRVQDDDDAVYNSIHAMASAAPEAVEGPASDAWTRVEPDRVTLRLGGLPAGALTGCLTLTMADALLVVLTGALAWSALDVQGALAFCCVLGVVVLSRGAVRVMGLAVGRASATEVALERHQVGVRRGWFGWWRRWVWCPAGEALLRVAPAGDGVVLMVAPGLVVTAHTPPGQLEGVVARARAGMEAACRGDQARGEAAVQALGFQIAARPQPTVRWAAPDQRLVGALAPVAATLAGLGATWVTLRSAVRVDQLDAVLGGVTLGSTLSILAYLVLWILAGLRAREDLDDPVAVQP